MIVKTPIVTAKKFVMTLLFLLLILTSICSLITTLILNDTEQTLGNWANNPNLHDKKFVINQAHLISILSKISIDRSRSHLVLTKLLLASQNNTSPTIDTNRDIEHHFLLASKYEITSHYIWALLAVHYREQQFYEKSVYALRKAAYLGPFENKTQRLLIPTMSFLLKDMQINENQNADIMKMIDHIFSFRRSDMLLLRHAKKNNTLFKLKPFVKSKRQTEYMNKFL